jgi:AraC-like DNA-binding protein
LLESSKERPGTSQKKRILLEQITAYVDAHLTEKLTLKDIFAHCGVSVSTVTQLFQKRATTTFHDFVTQRRLEMAQKLIREGMPLEQVGKEVGYRDHSTFYRAFRQTFGVSPREYRKNRISDI